MKNSHCHLFLSVIILLLELLQGFIYIFRKFFGQIFLENKKKKKK